MLYLCYWWYKMSFLGRIKRTFKKDNLKKVFNKIVDILKQNRNIVVMCIPFVLMHLYITIMAFGVRYNFDNYLVPLLFSVSWSILFLGISINIKDIFGKIFYVIICVLFAALFVTNGVYHSMMSTFFNFNLLESASEGSPYMVEAIVKCNPLIYIGLLTILISLFFGVKYYPKKDKWNPKKLGICLISFVILHTITPFLLGFANSELTWSSWRNARNIYETYNDVNKSIKVSGFFEYEIRDFYITFLKTAEQIKEEELAFLKEAFENKSATKNKYTGTLKGKNLIIVQLEGADNWIIDKNTTPTLYKLMNEGINFTNHFSFYNGGGSTFNSEFAINTGFVTPFSYNKNAYAFNKNAFPHSLAHIFKNMEYDVNVFHMNSGEYYSREINYLNWGYDGYYGLKDLGEYTDNTYQLDRELILNEQFNELIFNSDKKFVDYIITYSGHLPFTNTKGVCKMLYEEDHPEVLETHEYQEMSEEECIRRQNRETDYMVELLLKNLKEKNLFDNTVILFITDHYLYTVEDKTILDRYKETSNNLINKTPCFIWYKGVKSTSIKEVTSQLDILPTLLNLYGVEYNPNNYIGKDALQTKYKGIVFFSDYSWYDGNVYVEGGVVTNRKKISEDDLEKKNYHVSYSTQKNDLALKYNYFSGK